MRFLAAVPIVLCSISLILTFLCLFAGSRPGFMEDYALVTLNTSRIGENYFNKTSSSDSDNPLVELFNNITNTIEGGIEDAVNSLAIQLGLHDFYSSHIMNYCEGYYIPGPVPNATLPLSHIHKNITSCSNKTAYFEFDPKTILQKELNDSGHSYINIEQLQWPDDIDEGLQQLRSVFKSTYVFYIVAIVSIFIAIALQVAGMFFENRHLATANTSKMFFTFFGSAVASVVGTAFAVRSADIINEKGKQSAISATRGHKFVSLTWAATALLLVASVWECYFFFARRRERKAMRMSYIRTEPGRTYDEPTYIRAEPKH